MRDGEITLSYPGVSATVGRKSDLAALVGPLDLGDVAIEAADASRARGDGVYFGSDTFGGRTLTMDLAVSRPSEGEALTALATLRKAWRADSVRRTAGAQAMLSIRRAGRERAVFGRPRRFAPDLSVVDQGYIPLLVDFAAGDDLFYSPTESSLTVPFAAATGGGLVAPLVAPLTTTATSDRSVYITVGGDAPAWAAVDVVGPIVNPVVEVVGVLRWAFALTVPEGKTLRVRSAPWERTASLSGASVVNSLSRTSTRLARSTVPPGAREVVLRGASVTGTASATFRWRDTFDSL